MDSGTGGVHGTVFGGRKGEKLTKASADLEGNLKTLRDKACQRPRRRKVPPAKNATMHSCGDECHAVSQCVFVAKGAGHGVPGSGRLDVWHVTCAVSRQARQARRCIDLDKAREEHARAARAQVPPSPPWPHTTASSCARV